MLGDGSLFICGEAKPDVARDHWNELLVEYEKSCVAPPNLNEEVHAGLDREPQKFWACLWEAMLFRHFQKLGFTFRTDHISRTGQKGPDFGLIHGARTVWVEAVMPSPEGLPENWLNIQEPIASSVPHEAILLRWTNSLAEKRIQMQKRLGQGVVSACDPYVIAINFFLLTNRPGMMDSGISQLPMAVEAVFPIGPLAVQLSRDGKMIGQPTRVFRPSLRKQNGSEVPTDNFLNPEYSGISAVIACSRIDMLNDRDLGLVQVYNPLARCPLNRGVLGAASEYWAEEDNQGYILHFTMRGE